MKTLKFMLAAATAIGLASASQAAGPYNGSTDFESDTLDSSITASDSYWTVPSGAEEGDYTFVAGNPVSDQSSPAVSRSAGAQSKFKTAPAQVLQLEGGTEPLTRNIQATGSQVDLTAGEIYVDTLVKFTVTPAGDTVEVGANDKLMIYLKEGSASTNLVVKACAYEEGGGLGGEGETFTTNDYEVSSTVVPNTWYRLTVKAYAENGMTLFNVFLNGNQLQCGATLYPGDLDGKIFPALTGKTGETATSISCVGFAGSGAVDDLLFTTWAPEVSVVDFYLVLAGDVNGLVGQTVAYSNAVAQGTLNSGTNTVQYLSTDPTVTVTATAAAGYTATWDTNPNGINLTSGAYYTLTVAGLFPRTNTAGQDGSSAHPYEVASAADVKVLQEAVNCGVYADKCFVQTGNIDMTGVTDFYGIGWFKSSDSYASLPPGLPSASTDKPFTGVYDGGGYKISNVRLVRHNYAGVFNCVEGTVKNLTVENLGFVDTSAGEWGCGIVGNAQGNAILEYLTAATSAQDGFWGDNAPHNTAGIAARAEDSATIRYCVNNAAITASAKRLGGIISFTGTAGAASDVVSIIGCTNNGALYSSNGSRGVGGIIASPESTTAGSMTLIKDCANFGALTAGSSGFTGAIVGSMGVSTSSTWQDDGGNTYLASANLVGTRGSNTKAIVGLAYALPSTIDAVDYLTTVKQADLAAGNQYTLLADVAASETPVFTLQEDGDFIAFLLGSYTFAGTVDGAEGLDVTSATESGVTTFTAATSAPSGESLEPGEQSSTTYTTQADAEAAAANVTIAASDAVTNALDAAAQATYLANFEAKVVSAGEGQYKVEVALTTAATAALQAEVNADAAEVIEDLSESNVTLTTTPGFYYSFEYGTTLDNMAEVGTRTLATGSTLTLPRPTTSGATAGFYKVLVNIVPATVMP